MKKRKKKCRAKKIKKIKKIIGAFFLFAIIFQIR